MAALIYVLRTLVGEPIPLNGGCLRPVTVRIPERSLLSPSRDRAVAGGNVETSQRIVDTLLGAIGRVAASQGTMNNVTFGDERFGYYETIGGGAGAGEGFHGASGVQVRMAELGYSGVLQQPKKQSTAQPCACATFWRDAVLTQPDSLRGQY